MSQIGDLVKDKNQILFDLQDRWEDEKSYEDFEDYQKMVTEMFVEYGLTDVKLTRDFKISAKSPENKFVTVKILKSGSIEYTE